MGSGLCAGILSSVGPCASAEILPARYAPIGGILVYSFLTFFLLVTSVLGLTCTNKDAYEPDYLSENSRWFLTIPSILGVIRFLLWIFVFKIESPVYFMEKLGPVNGKEDIKNNLKKIYDDNDTEQVFNYLRDQHDAKQNQKKESFGTLFTKPYRKRFCSGLMINIIQQMSGINFFIFYSTTIFNKVSGNGDTVNFFMGITNFLSSFIGMFFLKLFGRKTN